MEQLLARWMGLLGGLGLPADDATGTQLLDAYAQVGRAYHNLAHLASCLDWLDEVREQVGNADEIELALWFHDAVYDPRRADNEEQSAAWAHRFLSSAHAAEDQIERVTALVRVTDHRQPPRREDEAWIVDIDLTILGAAPARYAAYEEAIRQEYAWVPEDVFRRKRAAVLHTFLNRRRIYTTGYFHTRLDADARGNLIWAIGRLGDKVTG